DFRKQLAAQALSEDLGREMAGRRLDRLGIPTRPGRVGDGDVRDLEHARARTQRPGHVADHQGRVDLSPHLHVPAHRALALVAPPRETAQPGPFGQLHGHLAVDRVNRPYLETGVERNVHVRSGSAEDDAVAEAARESAPNFVAAGHMREKTTVGEDGDCLLVLRHAARSSRRKSHISPSLTKVNTLIGATGSFNGGEHTLDIYPDPIQKLRRRGALRCQLTGRLTGPHNRSRISWSLPLSSEDRA